MEGTAGESRSEIGEEKHLDPSLKGAWERANAGTSTTDSRVRLVIREGNLYGVGIDPQTKEEVEQLILPKTRQREALELAHDCPLGGHMGEAATTARLLARVFWPGIYRDVKEYCSTCTTCQYTQPRGRPGGPLQPMPLTQTPFQRIAIDILGPLPKGKGGHQYIMVMVDYATCYLEAIPLRSTKSQILAAERLKIFSRVGFPQRGPNGPRDKLYERCHARDVGPIRGPSHQHQRLPPTMQRVG